MLLDLVECSLGSRELEVRARETAGETSRGWVEVTPSPNEEEEEDTL